MLMKEPQRWRLIQLRLVRSPSPCGRPIIHVHGTARAVVAIDPSPSNQIAAHGRTFIYDIYIHKSMYIRVHVYIRHTSAGLRRDVLASKFNIQTYLYICIYIYIFTPWHAVLSATRTHVNACAITSNSPFVYAAWPPLTKSTHRRPKLSSPHVCGAG
jgi:hypothetical protein